MSGYEICSVFRPAAFPKAQGVRTRFTTIMMLKAACSSLLLATLLRAVAAEVFSALVHVENAFNAEVDLAVDIRSYVAKEKNRLLQLTELAAAMENNAVVRSQKNLEQHLSNPVSAYATIRDLYNEAKKAEKLIAEAIHNSKEFYNVSLTTSELLPSYDDLQGAASALFRLQDTHMIPTYKIADGLFLDEVYQTGEPLPQLTLKDCINIGKAAYVKEDYYHAIMWLQEVVERMPADVSNETKFDVLDHLGFALYKQGNPKRAYLLTEEVLLIDPANERVKTNKDYYLEMLGQDEANSPSVPPLSLDRPLDSYKAEAEFLLYEQLCRGESPQLLPNHHHLSCRYTNKGSHPLLMYSPVKEEDVYVDPHIVFYHQFVSDYEIEIIKNISIPKLHRSGVFTPDGDRRARDYRTSKSAWLYDSVHPIIAQLSQRVSAVTGLSLATVEPLQVLNYGMGGHYEPHVDFARPSEVHHRFTSNNGNRIATFLNYISDVSSGGATVFPKIGATIWPEKGGAVFWYNLHPDGTGDERTTHAACPVLSGYKWIANKWFHEVSNDMERPCGLSKDS